MKMISTGYVYIISTIIARGHNPVPRLPMLKDIRISVLKIAEIGGLNDKIRMSVIQKKRGSFGAKIFVEMRNRGYLWASRSCLLAKGRNRNKKQGINSSY